MGRLGTELTRKVQQTERLLEVLANADLDFIVIGGVAAIAHGATTATQDLDVAMHFDADQLTKLVDTLRQFNPVHFTRPDIELTPTNADKLSKFRLLLIETDLGRLDVLSEVEPFGAIENVPVVELNLLPEQPFSVIALDALIKVKAHVARGKDKIMEQELRAVRAQREGAHED